MQTFQKRIRFTFKKAHARVWAPLAMTCAVSLLTILMSGCGEDFSVKVRQEETPPQPPPPPPSAEELANQAMQQLQILNVIPKNLPLQMVLSDDARHRVVEDLKSWQERMGREVNGAAAVERLMATLEDRLRAARDDQNPGLTLLLCDLLEALGYASTRIDISREWARVYNNRPVVVIKGWFQQLDTPEEEIYAFCEVYLPETGEVHTVQVREGDEFDGLLFVQIIGKNRGMRLRYLATNDTFEVYGPRAF